MLERIVLRNFKCFDELDLTCAPLTMLCGVNGMGKSSIIQALLVLRQSASSGDLFRGELVLGGELTDIGTGQDMLFEDAEENVIAFELHHQVPSPLKLKFRYSPEADRLNADEELTRVESWEGYPPLGGSLIYVSAERLGPRKFYRQSEAFARSGYLGARAEYALNYLAARQNEALTPNDPRQPEHSGRRLLDVVDHWLQEVTPGAHLQLEPVRDADAIIAGFSFDRAGDVTTRRFRATNVGFGLSYTLPVLTALLAPPGSLCLIENPEAHLHPRGQTRLAELAVRAALADVQVIVETHSDHFIDGIRIAVRDQLIEPDDTAFHYFDRKGGRTMVSSPKVDTDGRLSSWPEGFFDQHEENLVRLLAPRS